MSALWRNPHSYYDMPEGTIFCVWFLVSNIHCDVTSDSHKVSCGGQEEAPQLIKCDIQNGSRKCFLTACWQFIPRFPFSPRTTFIRQCRVRPFRCNPEQWCSISPRQLRMISGLKEKSSINMRR